MPLWLIPTLVSAAFGTVTVWYLSQLREHLRDVGAMRDELARAQVNLARQVQRVVAATAGSVQRARIVFGAVDAGAQTPLRIQFAPGTERWRLPDLQLHQIRSAFQHGDVYVHPRSRAEHVLGRPAADYAFRAFSRDGESHLFVDKTETPLSIAWLMAHELAHIDIDHDPDLQAHFDRMSPDLDPQGDAFHELDPEERHADAVARQVTGLELNRAWWRARTPNATALRARRG